MPVGMWRKQRKRRAGLSKNCGSWETIFCTVGRAVSSRKRKKHTTASLGSIARKKNSLLVHAPGNHPNRRADFHPGWAGGADSTLLRSGRSEMPWVFGRPAASHD